MVANRLETCTGLLKTQQEATLNYQTTPNPGDCSREFSTRAEVTLLCEVRQGTRPWKVARLDDISQAGFRIAWLPGVSEDKPLRIRIPGLQVLSADIRWRRDYALGCSFSEPLHIAVFEHIVRQSVINGPLTS